MIDIESIAPHAHRITAIADFREADVEKLLDFVKQRNEAGGGGNLLIDVTALTDFSFAALLDEIGHMGTFMRYIYGLKRIAIVSDEKWIRTAARLESAMLPGVVYQVYDDDEAETARAWVMEETDEPHHGAFRPIESGDETIAAFEIAGRLDRHEAERAVAMVRAAMETPGCSRLMLVISNWHGFDADTAFSREVMAGKLELIKKLERYAIVGGPAWVRNLAGAFGALLKPDIKSFEAGDEKAALAWLAD